LNSTKARGSRLCDTETRQLAFRPVNRSLAAWFELASTGLSATVGTRRLRSEAAQVAPKHARKRSPGCIHNAQNMYRKEARRPA